MAGTNAIVAKKTIVDRLAAVTGPAQALAGVQVSYIHPKDLQREVIYGGRIRFDDQLFTFSSAAVGGGRIPREETATLTFVVLVARPDSDQYLADLRAVAIGTVLEEMVAADPTLGGLVLAAEAESGEMEPLTHDDGVMAQLLYTISVRSELI